MSKQIRVMIMGSNPVVCELYKTVIDDQPGFVCTHVYHSCDQVFSNIPDLTPDVILVDFTDLVDFTELQEITGWRCIYEIRQMGFDHPVLVITPHEDEEVLFTAIRAGATGYLIKGFAVDELIVAIQEAFERKSAMSPALAKRMIQGLDGASVFPLTGKELSILECLSQGDTVKEIATQQSISQNAIGRHIYHIHAKIARQSAQNPLHGHPKQASYQQSSESRIQNHQ